jgi:eukaryotic-like serine/threonine-protein kinase
LKRLSTRFPLGVHHLAVAPDGRMLAASVGAGAGIPGQRVVLVDLERDQEVRHFQDPELLPGQSHEGGDLDLEFSPDGALLVSASSNDQDHMVKVWEVGSGRLVARHLANAVKDTSFAPDGRFLALTTATGATLLEVGGLTVQTRMAAQANPISSIACDPQGQVMACASGSRSLPGGIGDPDITVWSLTGDRQRVLRRIIPRQGDVGLCTHLAWLPDASALVSSWTSNRIVVVPLKDDGAPRTLETEANSQLSAIGVAPDGSTLWAAAGDTLWRWSTVDWSKKWGWRDIMGSVRTGKLELRALAVGRKSLIVGGRDGAVRLFDATNTPKFRRQWDVSTEPITQVALSPDERLIAAGSLDGTLALLDLQALQVPLKQNAHSGAIESLAFSRDGRLLATASKDQTVQLRSVSDGFAKAFLTLRSPTGPVVALNFSADGNRLYTVVRGETAVRIWHLDALKEVLKSFSLDWE